MIRAKNETERMVLKKFEDSYRSWKALPQDCPEYVWNAFYKQYQIIPLKICSVLKMAVLASLTYTLAVSVFTALTKTMNLFWCINFRRNDVRTQECSRTRNH